MEAAFADLAGSPVKRVAAILHERRAAGSGRSTPAPACPKACGPPSRRRCGASIRAGAETDAARLSRHVIVSARWRRAATWRRRDGPARRAAAALRGRGGPRRGAAADALADEAALALVLEHAPESWTSELAARAVAMAAGQASAELLAQDALVEAVAGIVQHHEVDAVIHRDLDAGDAAELDVVGDRADRALVGSRRRS